MTTFTVSDPSGHGPASPEGVEVRARYEGPYGPAWVGFTDHRLGTRAWGPHLPDASIEFGPFGRLDGRRHTSFVDPVALSVGTLGGEAVQPDSALLSRRRRGIVIRLGPRSYLYRRTGFAREMLEREDRTPVASLGGVLGSNKISETADAVDAALALVMFYAVPVTAMN